MSRPGQPATLQESKEDRSLYEENVKREWFLASSKGFYWLALEIALEDLEMVPEDRDTNVLRNQIVREMVRTGHPDFHHYAGEEHAAGERGPANGVLAGIP